MTAFGLPEDETFPLPPSSIQRLFVIGKATTNSEDQVDWLCGCTTQDGTTGLAYSLDLKAGPITCVMASYVYASTQDANTNGIRYDTGAGDTPFLSATEVIPVDLIAGTWGNLYASNSAYPQVFNLEPRRMGRFPIARQGRSFGQPKWSTVDTAKQWYHISNGFYLPWGGV